MLAAGYTIITDQVVVVNKHYLALNEPNMKQLTFTIIVVLAISSCSKCKKCYLVEESNGGTNEFYDGKYCGEELEDKENQQAHCPQTNCSYECR